MYPYPRFRAKILCCDVYFWDETCNGLRGVTIDRSDWTTQAYLVDKEWSAQVLDEAYQLLSQDMPLSQNVPGEALVPLGVGAMLLVRGGGSEHPWNTEHSWSFTLPLVSHCHPHLP